MTSNLQEFFENLCTEIEKDFGKKINATRRNFMSHYMLGIIQSRSVHASNIAAHMNTMVKIDSDIRRIERFLSRYQLDCETIALLIAFCLPKGKVKISMDRTEWKFGQKWCNILAVTVNCGSVGIPIWMEVLDKSRGISNTDERIKTLQKVIDLIGIKRIRAFFADREFIGQDWIDYLLEKKIIFFIRLRNNFWFKLNGEATQICQIAKEKLNSKKQLLFDNIGMYQTYLSLAISRTNDGKDFIAILTNSQARNAIKNYRQRWTIEVLFQCLKSRGFDLQSTHLQHDKRITKLFMMCSLAFALCLSVGIYSHYKIATIPKKNHGYKALSFFRKGLDVIRENIKLNLSMKKIFKELFDEAICRLQQFKLFSNFVG